MKLGIRTKKACKIARIDPSRFNEMVHAGHFPCAPETRPGSARIFDLDQTVALRIFGSLLSMAVAPERAGYISCAAYSRFAGRSEISQITYLVNSNGEWRMDATSHSQLGMPPSLCLTFDISELREQVGDLAEWELKFGEASRSHD